MSHVDLMDVCERLAKTLRSFGARFTPSLVDPHAAETLRLSTLIEACELFARAGHVDIRLPGVETPSKKRRTVASDDAIYLVPDDERMSLDLSKNIVVHFFVARALVSTALLGPRMERTNDGSVPLGAVKERVQVLSRLFKHEFLFRADTSFDEIFQETLAGMAEGGEIVVVDEAVRPLGATGQAQVALYVEILRNFLEAYRVAARGLTALLRGALTVKDVTKRAITIGERMFLAEEIVRREAISRPLLENACTAFVDQGYLTRQEGKIALAPSYSTPEAVKTIESRIALFLPEPP
jgi:glycerol-3-phosphate O-acyltransferase